MAHVWIIFGEMQKYEVMKKRASAHMYENSPQLPFETIMKPTRAIKLQRMKTSLHLQ